MFRNSIRMAVILLFASAIGAFEKPTAQAAKDCNWPATATFAPGGQIGDDDLGPYYDGQMGVISKFECNGQWHMELGLQPKYRGVRREAYIDLNWPVSGNEEDKEGIHQSSIFRITAIYLLQIPVGGTSPVEGLGYFFHQTNGSQYGYWFSNKNGHTGTLLRATRLSNTKWYLEAPPGSIAEIPGLGRYYITFGVAVDGIGILPQP